jgi:hypothetical protein
MSLNDVPFRDENGILRYGRGEYIDNLNETFMTEQEAPLIEFLNDFTWSLVDGIEQPLRKLEAVYDFIIRNFTYMNERDGAVIDGTMRPQNVPSPLSYRLTTGWLAATGEAVDLRVIDGVSEEITLVWNMLLSGEGTCNHFTALFVMMARVLGFDAHSVAGYYINTNGNRSGHAWAVILFDTGFFYFDPQIEASQFKRNRNNANYNPRGWWMQPINTERTLSRYDLDTERFNLNNLASQPAAVDITVIFNGEIIDFTQPPVEKGGYVFYALEDVFAAVLGGHGWDGATSTLYGELNGNKIEIPLTALSYWVNGVKLDVADYLLPFVQNERVYVILDFIVEGLGLSTDWDGETRTVTIKFSR